METIIFATKNKGKIKEINEILADMNVNVISMPVLRLMWWRTAQPSRRMP